MSRELIAAALTACDVAATDYEGAYRAKRDLREACARAMVQHAADREQESERQRQHAFDCRTCAHFTAKGCYSTVACIEARQYKATAPRQYWAALRGEVKP